MKRCIWVAVATLLVMPAMASAVNEVQLGTTEAYMYGGGVFKVPIIITNDVSFHGWDIAFRVTSNSPLTPESVIVGGRITDPTVVLASGIQYPHNAREATDSAGALLVVNPSRATVLPGTGTVGYIWFSGAELGDVITFEVVDSLYTIGTPVITTQIATDDFQLIKPAGKTTTVTVGPQVTIPMSVTGYTLRELRIPIDAPGIENGTVEVVSFIGPNGPAPFPTVSGSGPWEIVWTPAIYGTGAFLLTVRLSNPDVQIEKTIAIAVMQSVLTGDVDCNGKIDLSDLVRLINFLVNGTLPPICP